jgi:hypothetical protein
VWRGVGVCRGPCCLMPPAAGASSVAVCACVLAARRPVASWCGVARRLTSGCAWPVLRQDGVATAVAGAGVCRRGFLKPPYCQAVWRTAAAFDSLHVCVGWADPMQGCCRSESNHCVGILASVLLCCCRRVCACDEGRVMQWILRVPSAHRWARRSTLLVAAAGAHAWWPFGTNARCSATRCDRGCCGCCGCGGRFGA